MAWTAVITYAVGDPWTAAAVNTYVRDNLNWLGDSSGNLIVSRHLKGANGTPTLTVGASSGPGATATIVGSDTAGTVTITTGTGTSAGVLITVHFAATYSNQPAVLITPSGTTAQAAGLLIVPSGGLSQFQVQSVNAPTASASLQFTYAVIGT